MAGINILEIDIESFSDVDLSKAGVYRYSESPNFEILLFGYSVDGGDVKVVDLACGEKIPAEIVSALEDETVEKWAYNAQFERICLSRYLGLPDGEYLAPSSWKCSMVWAAYLGLPQSLENVGAVLGLEKQKLSEGKDLIRYFCVPCKPTKTNGGRTRNLPEHDREKWERFKAYNLRDVEAEMQIQQRLVKFPMPDIPGTCSCKGPTARTTSRRSASSTKGKSRCTMQKIPMRLSSTWTPSIRCRRK